MATDKYPLDEQWDVWFHRINDEHWGPESFMRLAHITSLSEFWSYMETVPPITSGMFYIMRSGIEPRWEDPANAGGGFWTFKLPKKIADGVWKELAVRLISEEGITVDPTDMAEITGISFSPKLSNSIFKIWNRDSSKCNPTMLSNTIPQIDPTKSFYRAHKKGKK